MDKRYCFQGDESGHWYLVPMKERELFDALLYERENEVEFENKFGDCRLNMHISNYSFADPKDIK